MIIKNSQIRICYSIFFLSYLIISCNSSSDPYKEQNLSEISDTINLASFKKVEPLILGSSGIEVGNNISNALISDSFLILSDRRAKKLLKIISIPSNKILCEIVTRGSSKGECLSVANLIKTSDSHVIWLYDISLVKFLKIDLVKASKEREYVPEEEIIAPDPTKAVKSPCWINDSLFGGCSYFLDDCRFILFNHNFQVSKRVGRLPPPQDGWPDANPTGKFGLLASSYTASMLKHPSQNLYAIAYSNEDRIDFFTDTLLQSVVRGPALYTPFFRFQNVEGTHIPIMSKKTRYSYTYVQGSDNYIYLIYSGQADFKYNSKVLLVFDWHGSPEKRIEFDKSYSVFAIGKVDSQRVIYTIDESNGMLMVARTPTSII
jgi:hypothetical protein